MKKRLLQVYPSIRIGDPAAAGTLMGPLVDEHSVANYRRALEAVRQQGGRIIHGGRVLDDRGFPAASATDRYLFNVYVGDTGDGAPDGYGTSATSTCDTFNSMAPASMAERSIRSAN